MPSDVRLAFASETELRMMIRKYRDDMDVLRQRFAERAWGSVIGRVRSADEAIAKLESENRELRNKLKVVKSDKRVLKKLYEAHVGRSADDAIIAYRANMEKQEARDADA